MDEQRGRKIQMEGTLALAEERRDIAKPLVERKLFSKVDYLDLEQKVLTLHGDIEALSSTMAKAAEAAQEAQRKLSLRKAEMEAQISEEINKRRTELTSLQETLSAGSDRVDAHRAAFAGARHGQANRAQHPWRRGAAR